MSQLQWMAFFVVLIGTATATAASSPEAWAALHVRAGAQCIKASNLTGAAVRGEPVDFADRVLLIIDGRHPQAHMKAARATQFCLHDKQTGKTEISAQPVPVATTSRADETGRTCWTVSFRAQLKSPRPIGAACTARNDEGDSYTGVVRR